MSIFFVCQPSGYRIDRYKTKIIKIELLPSKSSQFKGREQHGTLYERYLQSVMGTQSVMNAMDGVRWYQYSPQNIGN